MKVLMMGSILALVVFGYAWTQVGFWEAFIIFAAVGMVTLAAMNAFRGDKEEERGNEENRVK